MNTSPEAKQAAEKAGYSWPGYITAYAEGYDAATAKLRGEYEEVLQDHRRLVRRLDVALNGGGAAEQASLCDIVAQVEQLAHQQPSATCPDCKQPLSGDDLVDREVHGRCQSQGEPSATTPERPCTCHPDDSPPVPCAQKYALSECKATPDVEKIALDAAIRCIEFIRSEGQFRLVRDSEVQALLQTFLAQAREPLVKALKAWREFPHRIEPHCDDCAKAAIRAQQLTDAALTGTEEKL